jgi:hypothetical protein
MPSALTACLTACPDCTAELAPTAQAVSDTGCMEMIEQDCPDCEYDTVVAMLHYPDSSLVLIGPGDESDWVLERTGSGAIHLTDDEIRGHHRRAIEFAAEESAASKDLSVPNE